MRTECKLSKVTTRYLETYQLIFDKMVQGMEQAGLTDSISHNFIVQMIPHHQAAIEMSENILQYTTDLRLERIAENIIMEQTKGIAEMESILECCSECKNEAAVTEMHQEQMNQIVNRMFYAMEHAKTCNNVNCNFMWEMIPHHRGAVEMSVNTLRYDICQPLAPILQNIITSQRKGIMEMEQLLRYLCCRN